MTIKTIDGNRYEVNEAPTTIYRSGKDWMSFNVQGGVKHIAIDMIVSITEYEEEKD